MATTAEPSTVTAEQLADAQAKFEKALELRDSDIEAAVELLGQVLETRNKAYGENAPECADTYLYYGECLFEQAQAASDFFGDQMKTAANQRARAIAAAEAGADEDAMEAEEGAGDEADTGDAEAAADKPAADEAGPCSKAEAAAAPSTAPEAGTSKEPDATMAAAEDAPAAGAEGAEGAEEASGDDEEEGEDSESSSDEEEGAEEEGKAEGEEGAAAPEVTGESDDMALAWEMLELARLIYNNNGGPDAHANKLADCHLYIGDILAEQEKFEAAVEEYKTAQEMLARLEGGHNAHRRRAAELEFKKATALQLLDAPTEALAAMQAAKAHLASHLEAVNAQIAAAGSSGTDVSGAVASAAFASILSGYAASSSAPAAAPAADDAAKQGSAGEVAKLHAQASDLKATIESVADRIEELTAAVEEHVSMKEQLANIFKAVAAEGGEGGAGSSGGGSGKGAVEETVGFGGAGSSKAAAAQVQDMGVIGKGRRVAPVPVSAPAPAPASAEAGAAGEAGEAAGDGAAKAAAGGDGAGSKKRPLSDLTSSDQEQAAEGEEGAGGDAGAAAKLAAAAASAAAEQPDAAPKKARV